MSISGLLKYYDPELPGCKLAEDRHYFVGRILNSKEGGKSYTSCHKAEYCTDKSNKCDIEWKEGPNYVFSDVSVILSEICISPPHV
ncbi:hypothetical protein OESDEN_19806 [Oesophagostomum dentatum]|uniref:Uncharacterized protein n=1 Tax=Oesophagostomum dentatum TaxID=61180 RepID=A0A0B1S6G9_OESDE|nr:hypothetical protein OESDEN_19806 [Oesophagostomum dentatum]